MIWIAQVQLQIFLTYHDSQILITKTVCFASFTGINHEYFIQCIFNKKKSLQVLLSNLNEVP